MDAVFTPRRRTGSPALLSNCVPTTLSGRGSFGRLSWAAATPSRKNPALASAIERRFIAGLRSRQIPLVAVEIPARSDGSQDQAGVAAAEAERVRHRHADAMRPGLVGDQAEVDVGIIEIDRRRNGLVP